MKKRILFLGLLLIVFGFRLDAQTLKNIHRHNQPLLRIPTHLIDKVETAEVNGVQVLQVRQLNGYVSEIPLAQIDSITHSEGEAVDPAQLGNLRTASVMGVVSGPTGAPEMNAIVRSPYGGEETRTDPNGVFFLNNILVYDKLGYITITKPGFHQGSRSFLPLETGINRVNVQLLPMTQSGAFSAASGGTVTSGLLQLTFPANAITLNGQPYTGSVRVFAAALDPTSTAMFDRMPGELLGGMNDSLRLLRSFGMASVELRDTNMNELQLATSVSATLRFNIPTALQAEAQETIDWWSFDETLGYWKHEGEAQKQGNQYIGAASHFSWWNLDVPGSFNEFHGTVNSTDNTPISSAQMVLISPTFGSGINYTNSVGAFSGRVPKNQDLALSINLICSTTNDWASAFTDIVISEDDSIVGSYIAELTDFFPISGNVINCEGQPVVSGYVKLGPHVYLTNEIGQFTIQTCALGEYVIRGYDTSNADSVMASLSDTFQLGPDGINIGNLQTCTEFSGVVNDIDGHIYPTLQIGSQFWMVENLRSSSFVNGEPIPNVTDNTAWEQLITGAWCHYENNTANDSIYGKLYNWYTTVDPRGLCPAGWHVPTEAEWTVLTDYLGGESVAGGKMKTTTGWGIPNTGATNESSFSGLPGGNRFSFNGSFGNVRYSGNWWSSTESSVDTYASARTLTYSSGTVDLYDFNEQYGHSVRCLRD
jgi:uncharacterized protein (TIGR02145 family)